MEKTFKVKGMHCKSCEMLIADSLEEAGATEVAADFKKGLVRVTAPDGKLSDDRIRKIIEKEGYEAER